jgi:hypothetical protein
MVVVAIDVHHGGNGLPFPLEALGSKLGQVNFDCHIHAVIIQHNSRLVFDGSQKSCT